jgi:hypothetical protein
MMSPVAVNGNLKLAVAVLVPLLAAAVGFGVLKERVNDNAQRIGEVERRSELRLQRIEAKLDELLLRAHR